MDSDCCMSSPAAVYTPALSTKYDFGSASFTAFRGSVRGSGASGAITTLLGILESAPASLTKLTGTICARAAGSAAAKNTHIPRTLIPARRPHRVIFMQCVLHAPFRPAHSLQISSGKQFHWQERCRSEEH